MPIRAREMESGQVAIRIRADLYQWAMWNAPLSITNSYFDGTPVSDSYGFTLSDSLANSESYLNSLANSIPYAITYIDTATKPIANP